MKKILFILVGLMMLGSMSVHAGESDLINRINGITIGDPGVNGTLRVLPTVNKIVIEDIEVDRLNVSNVRSFAINEQGVGKMAIKEQGLPVKKQKMFLPSNFKINFRTMPTPIYPLLFNITPLSPLRMINNTGVKGIADGVQIVIDEQGQRSIQTRATYEILEIKMKKGTVKFFNEN